MYSVQNLTYARDICDIMRIDKGGNVIPVGDVNTVPSFGAAADGDADRNVGYHDVNLHDCKCEYF